MLKLPFDADPVLANLISDREARLYQRHFELLQDWNSRMALVSRKSIGASYENHYADSILISEFARKFYSGANTIDLGSGAGFPGMIFAIRYVDIRVTLFERVQKKARFLLEAVRGLGLNNVEVRAEWLREKVSGLVLARAVLPRKELFSFLENRITLGSIAIMNSGGEADISYVHKAFKLVEFESYKLPKDAGDRQIEAFIRI